jgi:hypothetical protein
MLGIEAVGVDVDHLQESLRNELHRCREKPSETAEHLVRESALAAVAGERHDIHALGKLGATQEILVAIRHGPQLAVRAQLLNIGFHQRRVLAQHLHLCVFLRRDLAHHLVQS